MVNGPRRKRHKYSLNTRHHVVTMHGIRRARTARRVALALLVNHHHHPIPRLRHTFLACILYYRSILSLPFLLPHRFFINRLMIARRIASPKLYPLFHNCLLSFNSSVISHLLSLYAIYPFSSSSFPSSECFTTDTFAVSPLPSLLPFRLSLFVPYIPLLFFYSRSTIIIKIIIKKDSSSFLISDEGSMCERVKWELKRYKVAKKQV